MNDTKLRSAPSDEGVAAHYDTVKEEDAQTYSNRHRMCEKKYIREENVRIDKPSVFDGITEKFSEKDQMKHLALAFSLLC